MKCFAFCQINDTNNKAYKLSNNGCICRSLNPHVQNKNSERVANDIDNCACQHSAHRITRASVGADNGCQRILYHGNRHHGKNNESIVMRHGKVCIGCANHQQQIVSPKIADRNNNNTGKKRTENGIAHAPVYGLRFIPPQRYT